jgi:hypothetical protein
MESGNSVNVLPGIAVGVVVDAFNQVKFNCRLPAIVENLNVSLKWGVKDRIVCVDPCPRFFRL